mmetsp:Transcript_20211/g.55806  ORF Transcript_20211/g.55806 Transcript_20211/m.55806 type:complete len:112 (+) Transcript_20211:3782-4117(+)
MGHVDSPSQKEELMSTMEMPHTSRWYGDFRLVSSRSTVKQIKPLNRKLVKPEILGTTASACCCLIDKLMVTGSDVGRTRPINDSKPPTMVEALLQSNRESQATQPRGTLLE